MKKEYILKYSDFIKEENETNTDSYKLSGIKKYLIKLLIKEGEIKDSKSDLLEYLNRIEDEGIDELKIAGLTEETDFFELYQEYRNEIDEKLSDNEYFDSVPSEAGVYSLYDYTIKGVKQAVKDLLSDVKNELTKE